MRARVNPFFEPGVTPQPSREPVRAFHRTFPGYAPTPLTACPALAAALGIGGLLIKDESGRFGIQSFKALGASWALHRLLARQPRPLTVSAATEGNHGRALAWAARQLGIPAVVFIPGQARPARIEHIRREGAAVELVEGTYDDAVQRCAEVSAANGWQVVADVGYPGYVDLPHCIVEGYSTLFKEAEEQRRASGWPNPEVVLIQAGVGGLAQAAVEHFRSRPDQPALAIVEPVEADPLMASVDHPDGQPTPSPGRQDSIMAGLNCGQVSLTAWPIVRRGVELFLTIEDRFAEAAVRRLAQPVRGDPAIEAGPSGAAGLAALLALLDVPELASARQFLHLDRDTRVLVVNTEGATDPEEYERIVRGEQ